MYKHPKKLIMEAFMYLQEPLGGNIWKSTNLGKSCRMQSMCDTAWNLGVCSFTKQKMKENLGCLSKCYGLYIPTLAKPSKSTVHVF